MAIVNPRAYQTRKTLVRVQLLVTPIHLLCLDPCMCHFFGLLVLTSTAKR